jgi:hypothetical protein
MKNLFLVLVFVIPLGIHAQPSLPNDPKLQDAIRQAALTAKEPKEFSRQLVDATTLRNELLDAAYSGDIDFLERNCDLSKTNPIPAPSPVELVGEALAGHQYDTVQWCASHDPDAEKASSWFSCEQMDLKAARIIVQDIPSLKTNFCKTSLDAAILGKHDDILKFLLESGLKPTDEWKPPEPLLAAIQLRDMEAISLLLQYGLDPYKRTKQGFSPVDYAIAVKSASLLKALDRDKKCSSQLADIEHELHPGTYKKFVGIWADLHEGFGSIAFQFYADGTGIVGVDFGGVPCFIKSGADGKPTKLFLLEGQIGMAKEPDEKQAPEIKIDGGDLVVVMEGEERRLKPFDPKAPTEATTIQRPYYLRLEQEFLSPANELYIQINGRFTKIPIDRLTEVFEPSGDEKKPQNEFANKMFRWSNFQKGQIPQDIVAKSTKVAYANKHTGGYFPDKLAYDFQNDASVKDGYEFTLFPYGSNDYYHGPDTDRYGELLDGFALLSKKPFSNGKNFLVFYILKTKSYDHPRPAPW